MAGCEWLTEVMHQTDFLQMLLSQLQDDYRPSSFTGSDRYEQKGYLAEPVFSDSR